MRVKGFGEIVFEMILRLVIEKKENKQEWADELGPNREIKGQRRQSMCEVTGSIRGYGSINLTLEFKISKL